MLAVHDLVVDIEGSRVLRGISLEVREGEFVVCRSQRRW